MNEILFTILLCFAEVSTAFGILNINTTNAATKLISSSKAITWLYSKPWPLLTIYRNNMTIKRNMINNRCLFLIHISPIHLIYD